MMFYKDTDCLRRPCRFLFYIFCAAVLLLLAACAQDAGPQQASSSSTAAQEQLQKDGAKRTYSIRLSNRLTWTVDREGNTVDDNRQFTVLWDIRTKEPQCKILTRTEDTGRDDEYENSIIRSLTAVYDMDGNPLYDWEEADYREGFGDFLIRISPPWGWLAMDGEKPRDFQCALWNYKTGEPLLHGVFSADAMEDGNVVLESWEGIVLGVVDANGTPVIGFPAPDTYYHAVPWNEYILATQIVSGEESEVLLTKELEPVLTRKTLNGTYYGIYGRYLFSQEGAGREEKTTVLTPKGKTVFSCLPGENIQYFDGELAIIRTEIIKSTTSAYRLESVTAKDHPVLAKGFSFLEPAQTYTQMDADILPTHFLGIQGQTALLIDRTGKTVASLEIPGVTLLNSLEDDLYIYEIGLTDGTYTQGLLNGEFQEIIPSGIYDSMDRVRDWSGVEYQAYPFFLCDKELNGIYRTDIRDLKGQLIAENVSQVYDSGPDRLAISKGFDTGLIDEKGNWIVKRSVFAELGDD